MTIRRFGPGLAATVLICFALLGCARHQAPPVQLADMDLPVYFGSPDAPNTILLYTNPQCPPCRRSWPRVRELLTRLDPQTVRLVVVGRGFSEEGSTLLFLGSLLAERHPETAVEFLTAVMRSPDALSADPVWLSEWLRQNASGPDLAALEDQLGSPAALDKYLSAVTIVRDTYRIESTPSIFINGSAYDGPVDAAAVMAKIRETAPRP